MHGGFPTVLHPFPSELKKQRKKEKKDEKGKKKPKEKLPDNPKLSSMKGFGGVDAASVEFKKKKRGKNMGFTKDKNPSRPINITNEQSHSSLPKKRQDVDEQNKQEINQMEGGKMNIDHLIEKEAEKSGDDHSSDENENIIENDEDRAFIDDTIQDPSETEKNLRQVIEEKVE